MGLGVMDKSDLKKRFCYVELEAGKELERRDFKENHYILFFLSGKVEVIYFGSRPQSIEGGNMVFLGRLADCVIKAVEPVRMVLLAFDDLANACDKITLQNLVPISSLLKYEFDKLEIRSPLDHFLELILIYLEDKISGVYLWIEKQKELFIILRTYYTSEELAMFFYPLVGKNIDFKKMVFDSYSNVGSIKEFAEKSGYSPVVFQRRFKEVFGETVYQWMQRQKAEHIKHRLMTEDVNLKELADEFEFASAAHLNKFCKIWFGMSPSELRETLLLKRNLK